MAVTDIAFLPIEGTFDIALARRAVRVRLAAHRWAPTAHARVSAALTALGELILLPCVVKAVVVKFDFLDIAEGVGIELSCTVFQNGGSDEQLPQAQERLKRAADDVFFTPTANGLQIAARIWVNGGRA
jgi:hypothetical protein